MNGVNGVDAAERSARRFGAVLDVGLGVVFALVLVLVAARYAREGRVWLFDVGVGSVVCAAALLRERLRDWAPVIGLAVAGAAGLVAVVGGLPGEPGAAAALGLAVLAGSAVRVLPAPRRPGSPPAACCCWRAAWSGSS